MNKVKVLVLDNDNKVYCIDKEDLKEWNKWKYLEDDIIEKRDIPKSAVEVDWLDLLDNGNFTFKLENKNEYR